MGSLALVVVGNVQAAVHACARRAGKLQKSTRTISHTYVHTTAEDEASVVDFRLVYSQAQRPLPEDDLSTPIHVVHM